MLRDEFEESVDRRIGGYQACLDPPAFPELYRVLEAQLARQDIGVACRIGHQSADQVVGQQMNPDFLFGHVGCLAAQRVHAQRGFDMAQIDLDIPALLIEPLQCVLGPLLGINQRRHQHFAADRQLSDREVISGCLVILRAHPIRFFPGLGQDDPMVTGPQLLPAPKIRRTSPRAVLLEHAIDTALGQVRQKKTELGSGLTFDIVERTRASALPCQPNTRNHRRRGRAEDGVQKTGSGLAK